MQFSAASYSIAEGYAATVEVSLSASLGHEIVIPVQRELQSATAGDYWGGPRETPLNLVFPAGDTEESFIIGGAQDILDEPRESFVLTLDNLNLPTGISLGVNSRATVEIVDDDYPAVQVQFATDSYTIEEGENTDLIITLNPAPERPIVIPVSYLRGQGLADSDFWGIPSNIVFSSNETSKVVTFHTIDNNLDRPDKTLDIYFGKLPGTGASSNGQQRSQPKDHHQHPGQ